jgi:hypothetical protein
MGIVTVVAMIFQPLNAALFRLMAGAFGLAAHFCLMADTLGVSPRLLRPPVVSVVVVVSVAEDRLHLRWMGQQRRLGRCRAGGGGKADSEDS